MTKPYRACVGIALLHPDGRVFVGERIDTPGAWQMPQGGIDEGEDIIDAAYRELHEETGIARDSADLIRVADTTVKYDLPEALQKKLWKGRYAGQEQTWVAMRFTGADSNVDLNVFDPPEFSNWQWVNLKDTIELIVPFKRDLYQNVIALFSDLTD